MYFCCSYAMSWYSVVSLGHFSLFPSRVGLRTYHDPGSKHCDEYIDPIRIYAFMISDSVCFCMQSTTLNIYAKNLKHKLSSKFYRTTY